MPWATPLGLAYREWLLSLARTEADAGCPRLFGVKGELPMYFADLAAGWGAEQRYHLMCGRVKWLCEHNYGYAPIPVTDEENAASALLDYPFYGRDLGMGAFRSPGKPAMEIAWGPSGRRKIVDADKVGAIMRLDRLDDGAFKVNKKLLRTVVKDAMRQAFGAPVVSDVLRHACPIPELTITTSLDFGGNRPTQLRYRQWVHRINGSNALCVLDHGGVSALLGWPQTEWCYLSDEDIPAAAGLLVRLCTEFVEAIPGMWESSGLRSETAQS